MILLHNLKRKKNLPHRLISKYLKRYDACKLQQDNLEKCELLHTVHTARGDTTQSKSLPVTLEKISYGALSQKCQIFYLYLPICVGWFRCTVALFFRINIAKQESVASTPEAGCRSINCRQRLARRRGFLVFDRLPWTYFFFIYHKRNALYPLCQQVR